MGRRTILTVGVLGAWGLLASGSDGGPASLPAVQTTAKQAPRRALPAAEQAIVDLFEEARPSVVYITTLTQRRDVFTGVATEVPRGTGSGFVWDDEGHVVTNLHVLQGATAAQVVLHDQSTYRAGLVGFSRGHDLAVLKIDAPSTVLRPVRVGRSDDLRVGQSIFAIGNPFGLSATLTTGIVSALGREIAAMGGGTIENMIQISNASRRTVTTSVGRSIPPAAGITRRAGFTSGFVALTTNCAKGL